MVEPVISWPPELRGFVHPRRGGAPSLPVDDPASAFDRMREIFAPSADAWARSPTLDDPELGPCLRAALARLAAAGPEAPSVAAPAVEGLLLTVLSSGRSRVEGEVISFWVATAGLPFAVEALAASRGLWSDILNGIPRITFLPADPAPKGLRHWLDLRRRLAAAAEEEWAAARATAERLRTGAPLELRAALAYLFPDVAAWAEEDALEALATRKTKKLAGCLACSLADTGLLQALASASDPPENLAPQVEAFKADFRGLIVTLVDGAGRAAVPVLLDLLERTRSEDSRRELVAVLGRIDGAVQAALPVFGHLLDRSSAAGRREVLAALAQTPAAETAAVLASRLDRRDVGALLQTLGARQPREVLAALATHLREGLGGPAGERALALFTSLARHEPELAATLLPELPEKVRRLLQPADSQELPRDAEPSELPPVLASPPWTRKRKSPPRLDLTPLPWEDRLIWEEGQRERWLGNGPPSWFLKEWESSLPSDPRDRDRAVLLRFGNPHPDPLLEAQGDELRRRVAAWAAGYRKIPDLQILYLSDELALALWEAVPASLRDTSPEIIERIVARFEERALPGLPAALARIRPADCVEAIQPVSSPAFAPVCADALARLKSVRPAARRWLLAHDEPAAMGLIPAAVGPAGKAREAAGAALRFLAESGREDLVLDIAGRWGDAARQAVRAVLAADSLDRAPARPPKLPPFWQPATLTRPLLRGRSAALPLTAVETLGQILAFSRLDEPYAGIPQVREACDPASLAAFAWDLFTAWQTAGAPPKEQWAFHAVGHLGDDASARRLAPLIRDWPSAGAAARAATGLDVLRALGTDVALMYLHGFAQKTKSRALQDKAREKIAEIAEQRGLTPEELADRLVPDLGLGADGSLRLDFGPRAFRVGFDEHLRPFVQDAGGKRLTDLPKPGAADDPEIAQQAHETWKVLKKDVKTLATQQILRLELAMCGRRRWEPAIFRMFFVEHPLLQHLVRRLVWGAWEEEDHLLATFRVVEDGTCAGPADDAWELPGVARVGLVHRLDLTSELAARWGEILGDYEILQPFPQLGREVWTIEDGERESSELHRLSGAVPTGRVLALERRGWRRGAMDGAVISWFSKPLPGGSEAILVLDPGIDVGDLAEDPEQTLEPLTLSRRAASGQEGDLLFGALDPVTFSELVRDLKSLQ